MYPVIPAADGVIRLALIGRPVDQSPSPAIFAAFSEATGVRLEYRAIDTGPEELARTFDKLRSTPGQRGFNVTIPHKVDIGSFLDGIPPRIKQIGAVNTVVLEEYGAIGYNTDLTGIADTLDGYDIDVSGRTAVLFGAGGAARAGAAVLAGRKLFRLFVVTRERAKAEDFAEWLTDLEPRVLLTLALHAPEDADLYVNATPVGEGLLPDRVRPGAVAFDMNYRPRPITAFVAAATRRGMRAVDGLPMLVGQAAAAYNIWFGAGGVVPPEVKARVLRMLQEKVPTCAT